MAANFTITTLYSFFI